LEFNPSIKGTSRWLDRRTLEFKPAARLTSGQIYEARFFLSKLLVVSKELSVFEYNFQVIPQNFELTIENVKPYVKTELTRQKIEGSLFTADFAEPGAMEQVLQARQEGKLLKVNWTHSSEGKQHWFVVEEVTRKDSSSVVKLSAQGGSLGTTQTDERNVEIPALGDFKVMNVRVEQSGNQHVVLQFSDPLSEKQNLEGLITISELQSLDFEVKDNEIHVYPPVKQRWGSEMF
jgi:alpha-2-macroglobulin